MPERILRDWSDSKKFDGFPGNPETLFVRLLMKADDYGRFTRDPINVRAACFPRAEALRANTVDAWLKELSDHRLIFCYQVSGESYLAIINFRQRLRIDAKTGKGPNPKYPPPEGQPMDFRPDDGNWRELAATSGEPPPYAYANAVASAGSPPISSKPVLEKGSGEKPIIGDPGSCREVPTEDEAVAMTMTAGVDEAFTRYVYRTWATQNGRNGNGLIVEFLPHVVNRWKNEQVEWRHGTHRGNRKNAGKPNARNVGLTQTAADKSADVAAVLARRAEKT